MLKCLPVIVAVGLGRQALRYLWRPRIEPYKNLVQPPYERLLVSAVFSRLAYKSLHEFRKESVKYVKDDPQLFSLVEKCFTDEVTFIDASTFHEFHDTQVYVWIKDRILYIVFRGSESKEDFLANIDLRRKCIGFSENILIHNGFRRQFEAVEEKLTDFILKHKNEFNEIYFLGHSLGMACATISALFYNQYFKENYEEQDIPIMHCHTFGGPRVGNKKFAEFYQNQTHLNQNTWRIVNYADPVPRVPISMRFYHIPSKTLLIGDKNLIQFIDKDDHWLFRPLELFVSATIFRHFKPHFIERYIENLRDIVILAKHKTNDNTIEVKKVQQEPNSHNSLNSPNSIEIKTKDHFDTDDVLMKTRFPLLKTYNKDE